MNPTVPRRGAEFLQDSRADPISSTPRSALRAADLVLAALTKKRLPISRSATALLLLLCSALTLLPTPTNASDSTWLFNPVDSNWNSPANWSMGLPSYVATFDQSEITDINISQDIGFFGVVFDNDADPFTITAAPGVNVGISSGGIWTDCRPSNRISFRVGLGVTGVA